MICFRFILSCRTWTPALCLAVLLSGCSTEVSPVLGTERAFSLYGVFTPQDDTQKVIVFPIEEALRPPSPEPLGARFTTTELESGEVRRWQDSLTRDAHGLYTHVFWSPFTAGYGRTYRIEVERTDGAMSHAVVAVPPYAEVVPQEPTVLASGVTLPVRIDGAVPRLMKIELEYFIKFRSGPPEETTTRVTFSYEGRQKQVEEGWLIHINLSDDYRALRDFLQRNTFGGQPLWDPAFGIVLLNLTLRLVAASEDWYPPGGTFDPEVLVEPGTMSNVENGFGFVGAGYRLEKAWLPSLDARTAAGFRIAGQ